VLHCKSKRQAEYVLDRIRERFQACKLELRACCGIAAGGVLV
jgi:hypothetical protein